MGSQNLLRRKLQKTHYIENYIKREFLSEPVLQKYRFSQTGVNVMITIFCDFGQLPASKLGVFSLKPML
jgi:hypothetical protein